MLLFSHPTKLIKKSILLTLLAAAVVSGSASASSFSSKFSGKKLCSSMAHQIEALGLSSAEAHEYVFDVVSAIRSGNYMDYLEVQTPDDGKRFLTTDMLFSEAFFLRKGRTQIVNFEMLKRLPRSSVKMDYLVVITPDDSIDDKKVSAVIRKANQMGVRFFPIWAGRTEASQLLVNLSSKTRGEIIDLSGRMNPCASASSQAKLSSKTPETAKESVELVNVPSKDIPAKDLARHNEFSKDLRDLIK
ncbi:hypothetical protein N9W79_01270 [bacterium]|nr:hypothetical protein [bacterium]